MEHRVLQIVIWRQGREITVGKAEMLPDGKLTGSIDIDLLNGEIESRISVVIPRLVISEKINPEPFVRPLEFVEGKDYRVLESRNYLDSPFTHHQKHILDEISALSHEPKPLEDEDDLSPLEED